MYDRSAIWRVGIQIEPLPMIFLEVSFHGNLKIGDDISLRWGECHRVNFVEKSYKSLFPISYLIIHLLSHRSVHLKQK